MEKLPLTALCRIGRHMLLTLSDGLLPASYSNATACCDAPVATERLRNQTLCCQIRKPTVPVASGCSVSSNCVMLLPLTSTLKELVVMRTVNLIHSLDR